MTPIAANLRLYLANRTWAVFTPIYILLIMLGLSLIIGALIGLATGYPLPEGTTVQMRMNNGALYSVPGFLISVGALAMNRNFSMALAFGSTRRNFWLGTSVGFLVTSLTVALGAVVLLGLELATNHWFFGARAFDVAALGDGNVLQTFATMFVVSMLSLYLGAFFGTIYRAFGPIWVTVAALGIGLLLAVTAAFFVVSWDEMAVSIMALGAWLVLAVGVIATLLSAAGSYAVNRVATP